MFTKYVQFLVERKQFLAREYPESTSKRHSPSTGLYNTTFNYIVTFTKLIKMNGEIAKPHIIKVA